MRRIIFPLLLLASPAIAAAEPPAYVPFTVGEGEFKGLSEYLAKQPMGIVEPIVQWLRQKEAEAIKERAPKPKPEDSKHDDK